MELKFDILLELFMILYVFTFQFAAIFCQHQQRNQKLLCLKQT